MTFTAQQIRLPDQGVRASAASGSTALSSLRDEAPDGSSPSGLQSTDAEALSPEEAWQELVEYDDRTSPEEYPDMALITFDELRSFMERGK